MVIPEFGNALPKYKGWIKVVTTLLSSSLQTSEGVGSSDVCSCLCTKKFLPSYAKQKQKEASNIMKARNG